MKRPIRFIVLCVIIIVFTISCSNEQTSRDSSKIAKIKLSVLDDNIELPRNYVYLTSNSTWQDSLENAELVKVKLTLLDGNTEILELPKALVKATNQAIAVLGCESDKVEYLFKGIRDPNHPDSSYLRTMLPEISGWDRNLYIKPFVLIVKKGGKREFQETIWLANYKKQK